MTSAVSMFGRKSEFDPFLHAPVGEERNGMLLSVLSALARLDVDPWQEAATLTKMPAPDATLRLTSLLLSLPSDAATMLAPSTVLRLIALLPKEPLRDSRPREMSVNVTARYWMVAFYFLMAFVLMFAEQFAENRHAPASTARRPDGAFQRSGAIAEDGSQSRPGNVTSRPIYRVDPAEAPLTQRWTKRGAVHPGWAAARGGNLLTLSDRSDPVMVLNRE